MRCWRRPRPVRFGTTAGERRGRPPVRRAFKSDREGEGSKQTQERTPRLVAGKAGTQPACPGARGLRSGRPPTA